LCGHSKLCFDFIRNTRKAKAAGQCGAFFRIAFSNCLFVWKLTKDPVNGLLEFIIINMLINLFTP